MRLDLNLYFNEFVVGVLKSKEEDNTSVRKTDKSVEKNIINVVFIIDELDRTFLITI